MGEDESDHEDGNPPEIFLHATEKTNVLQGTPVASCSQTSISSSDTDLKSNLPIKGDDFRFGNILITSKFDSGNLCRVERVVKDPIKEEKPGSIEPIANHEFNVWTRPDAAGTEFENGNRSWFYFGVRGVLPGKLIKINIMNLNKQGKLYSQGHAPIFRVLPHKPQWDRLKERCQFENNGNDFILTFYYRFTEMRGTAYFAFSFPWSYTESLQQMDKLDLTYQQCKEPKYEPNNKDEIYYHRELYTHTLDSLRVDLLTISSYHGISDRLEPRYDTKLFPDPDAPRPRNFPDKRAYVITSRVHPGETPASSVYNGFLEFILRPDDKRAIQLRREYVFKLIPMLNPDGCVRGHYRTDSQGINLNRLYLEPEFHLYPTIYAAKSLIVFHHVNNCSNKKDYIPDTSVIFQDILLDNNYVKEETPRAATSRSSAGDSAGNPDLDNRLSSKADFYHPPRSSSIDDHTILLQLNQEFTPNGTEHLNHPRLRLIPHEESGVAFYVDLHGHASKRGCFIYGNHHLDEDKAMLNLLFPKLIALNSAHFDFGGCNFTEKNMYMKDKRDGHSKEGSGRVAIYKSIGIVHSYTLECNYNSGRLVNSVAPTTHERVTPPPAAGFPPKFMESHYEEVGRALAIAAIDYTETNPMSRIPHSEYSSLEGVKEWLRKSLRGGRGITRFNKPSLTLNPRIMNRPFNPPQIPVAPAKSETLRARQNNSNTSVNVGLDKSKTGFSFGKQQRFSDSETVIRKADSQTPSFSNQNPTRRSLSLPSPTSLMKGTPLKPPGNVNEMAQTRSFTLRNPTGTRLLDRSQKGMHTLSKQSNTTVQVLQAKQRQTKPSTPPGVISSVKTKENKAVKDHANIEAGDTNLQSPAPTTKLGTLNAILLKNNFRPTKIPVAVSRDLMKATPPSALMDKARELGMQLEQNLPAKLNNLRRKGSSGKRKKGAASKNSRRNRQTPTQVTVTTAPDERFEIVTKPLGSHERQREMDNFEQQLRQRISTLEHPQAYWVEL